MKIKLGIIFGGPSKEREISFAGGRTVYDNIDKSVFEPIPIFVDSYGMPVLIDWQYIYKGSIRDFFPPVQFHPECDHDFQIYQENIEGASSELLHEMKSAIGDVISWEELAEAIDFAFLCLHGEFGEDGVIQGLLESLRIPYSGSGIRACSIGIDKAYQKKLMERAAWPTPKIMLLERNDLNAIDWESYYKKVSVELAIPLVVRPAKQGSSLGVSILRVPCDSEAFRKACLGAFFIEEVDLTRWRSLSLEEKLQEVRRISDLREGIGLPCEIDGQIIYHPETLFDVLNYAEGDTCLLENLNNEETVLLEEFIHGTEFSGVVIKDEKGNPVCLPPTEIIKTTEVYDYRAKYLPGLARKKTPISLPLKIVEDIQKACEDLFVMLDFQAYARIDGFLHRDGTIYLNDPNTTSGMLPSSFFFHQAAEIGLNPSQIISYIIWISLKDRIQEQKARLEFQGLLEILESALKLSQQKRTTKKKIGVLMGGYSFERHISVESGRNIFEKLESSEKYEPIPIFLSKDGDGHSLHLLPTNLMLKDNADDILDSLNRIESHAITRNVRAKTTSLRNLFQKHDEISFPKQVSYEELGTMVDAVFIALHGRPGEDGEVQTQLQSQYIPFNGSDATTARLTINKYDTLKTLKENGFITTPLRLINKEAYLSNGELLLSEIEVGFDYPFIIKPVDDGCSSAVFKISDRQTLSYYLDLIFLEDDADDIFLRKNLGLSPNEEFPKKTEVLIEKLIVAEKAKQFMEITIGLFSEWDMAGIKYTIFEPSEALSGGDVLSLEEKFLAGEGLNITPARLGQNLEEYERISSSIKNDIERAARVLNIEGYARIDAFVRVLENDNVETIIIEVNNLPGMTPATCIFHQAAINGLKPYDFIDKILNYAFNKQQSISR